jgi:hypothetical protein
VLIIRRAKLYIKKECSKLVITQNRVFHYSRPAVGRDSSVAIATRYGLNGAGIEFLSGRDFRHPSRPTPDPPSTLYYVHRVSFQEIKRPELGADHPPPSSVGVKQYSHTSTPPVDLHGPF